MLTNTALPGNVDFFFLSPNRIQYFCKHVRDFVAAVDLQKAMVLSLRYPEIIVYFSSLFFFSFVRRIIVFYTFF